MQMENEKQIPLTEISMKYVMQCIANPHYLISVSGNYLVLYDQKKHRIISYEPIDKISM